MKKTLQQLDDHKIYFKNKTPEEMVELLNKELPVKLLYNEDLVNRIHAKYPMLSKTQISVIVLGTFQSIRDLLILGKDLSINTFFNHFKFIVLFKGKNKFITQYIGTPKALRNFHGSD